MGIRNGILLGLLPLVPLSLVAEWQQWGATAVFVTAGLALVPLSGLLSQATEKIALVVGPNAGGLLNATLGNATELIVAFLALKSGLIGVVKASITGSILSNLLLVMGLAMLLGGLRYPEQTFQPAAARANASAMNLAVVAILLPTAVDRTSSGISEATLQPLSVAVALVLIAVYGLTLLFSLKTHAYLYEVSTTEHASASEAAARPALLPWGSALLVVAIAIVGVAGGLARGRNRPIGPDAAVCGRHRAAGYRQRGRACRCRHGGPQGQNGFGPVGGGGIEPANCPVCRARAGHCRVVAGPAHGPGFQSF